LQASGQTERSVREDQLSQALRLNELAQTRSGLEQPYRALLAQRAELAGLLGRAEEAKQLRAQAGATPLRTPMDRYLVAADHVAQGRFQKSLPLLSAATEEDPQDFWAWFLLGVSHDGLSQNAEAAACYSTCIALSPSSPWAYFNRALAQLRQQNYKLAASDFDHAIELRPNLVEAYTNRALARQGLRDYPGAVEDLTRALEL